MTILASIDACHVERSETSLIVAQAVIPEKILRFFAALSMTL
jgi:hypothetical protein